MPRTKPCERGRTPPRVHKRPAKRRLSSGASLLEVVELGGGSATDLAQALLEADPDEGEAALLASALRAAKQNRAGEDAAVPGTKQERKAAQRSHRIRSRGVDLVSFVERSGGSLAGLMDVLAERGGAAKDLELASAALGHALSQAAAGGGAEADAGGASDAGAASGQKRKSSEGSKACTVCRNAACAAEAKKACGTCRALADRLKEKSGGLCKRKHLRGAVAELGSDAKRGALKRRALQLAGAAPADPPAAAEADAAAEAEHAAVGAPAAAAGIPRAAHAAPNGTGAAQALSVSSSVEEITTGPAAEKPRAACKAEPSTGGAGPGACTPQACERKPRLKTPAREGDAHTHAANPSAAAAASPAGLSKAAAAGSGAPPAPKKARTAVKQEAAATTQRQESASGAAAREVKLCFICDSRPRMGSGSYCGACASISKSLAGRGKTDLIRAAWKELGVDAARADVKAHVRRAQEKAGAEVAAA